MLVLLKTSLNCIQIAQCVCIQSPRRLTMAIMVETTLSVVPLRSCVPVTGHLNLLFIIFANHVFNFYCSYIVVFYFYSKQLYSGCVCSFYYNRGL